MEHPLLKRTLSRIPHWARRWLSTGLGPELSCATAVLLSYFLWWDSAADFAREIDGGEIFFLDFLAHYFPTGEAFARRERPVEGYLYSSFFALLMALLALVPAYLVTVTWTALQVVMAIALYSISARRLLALGSIGRVFYLLLFLTSLPLLHNFKYGQVSVLIVLGISLTLSYHREGRSTAGGLVLAAVASIKYYPAIALIYFVFLRDIRFLTAFAVGIFGFLGLLPALWLGLDGWWSYTSETIHTFPKYDMFLGAFGSQYFLHVALRWAYNLGQPLTEHGYHVLRWLSVALFIAHAAFAAWLYRQGSERGPILATAALFLTLPMAVPSSWPHYFVYLPLCQAALAAALAEQNGWPRLLWLPLALSALGQNIYFYIAFSSFSSFIVYYSTGVLAVANLLALATLYGLGVALYWQRRSSLHCQPCNKEKNL